MDLTPFLSGPLGPIIFTIVALVLILLVWKFVKSLVKTVVFGAMLLAVVFWLWRAGVLPF